MHHLWLRLTMATLGASLIGLAACTSPPSRFYILHTLSASEMMPPVAQAERGPIIGVGPVNLPKYLDRPQIVTRASQQQLVIGEFDRWAEPLPENVSRVLAENLALLMSTDHALLFPWPRAAAIDYQVRVDVWRFDGTLGRESSLIARWSILDRNERELLTKKSQFTAAVGTREYEALVAALNQMLEALSRD